MTAYATPGPISASVELGIGDLRLVATGLAETVVEVRPTDPGSDADVHLAAQTRVDFTSGVLLVRGPKNWRQWTRWGGGRESVDVEIRLPAGSRVSADVGMANVQGTGRLGEVDLRTGMGDVRLDETGPAKLKTGFGDITVGRIEGDAEVRTGSGRVDLGFVGGAATVKNSNGDSRVGHVEGRAQLQNANGAIEVGSAGSGVSTKSACGDIRLLQVSHGVTEVRTAYGRIDVGVLEGVAAWLDLSTGFGRVVSELEQVDRPPAGAPTTEVRARTAAGDIGVFRVPARTGAVVAP